SQEFPLPRLSLLILVVGLLGISEALHRGQNATLEHAHGIAAIQKLGGTVEIDTWKPGRPVVGVNLSGVRFTYFALPYLRPPESYGCNDSLDDGFDYPALAYLRGLTSLKTLNLESTNIANAGLMYFQGLTNLRELSLRRTGVTGDGLIYLRGLTSL